MSLSATMSIEFRDALIWHMEQHKTSVAKLVRATGVSRDVINKLRSRPDSSTTAENAMLIAAFYGKSVNAFISKQEVSSEDRLTALFSLLEPEERQFVEAQVRGLISAHAGKQA